MADTVATVASQVQFLADDWDGNILDVARQLPAINAGWREFQRRAAVRELPFMRATAEINVTAGVKTLTLPADFDVPLVLHEKQLGSTDFYENHEMVEKTELPDIPPDFYLRYWKFEAGSVFFLDGSQWDLRIANSPSGGTSLVSVGIVSIRMLRRVIWLWLENSSNSREP